MGNNIVSYFHCRKCIEELPKDVSAADYQSIEVGVDAEGTLIIWCKRHDLLIGSFIPEQKLIYRCERCEDDRGHQGN